jgi:hypothetical protein
VDGKSHSPHSHRSQSRQLVRASISSLLNNSTAGSLRARSGGSSRVGPRSHQSSSNKARSLRKLAVNRSLRLDARSERHSRRQTNRVVGRVVAGLGVGLRWVEDFVDDVQDAVLDQDVGVDHARGVDKDAAFGVDDDVEFFAVESWELGVVAEGRRVPDCSLDDVVGEDLGELLVGDVAGGAGDSLESVVVGTEDGYVGEVFEGGDEADLGRSSSEGCPSTRSKSLGVAQWDE